MLDTHTHTHFWVPFSFPFFNKPFSPFYSLTDLWLLSLHSGLKIHFLFLYRLDISSKKKKKKKVRKAQKSFQTKGGGGQSKAAPSSRSISCSSGLGDLGAGTLVRQALFIYFFSIFPLWCFDRCCRQGHPSHPTVRPQVPAALGLVQRERE